MSDTPLPHLQAPAGENFPRRMRLSGSKQFKAVYDARLRKSLGPLLVYGRPNGLAFSRLGMAVPRRVGNAVTRVAIKRRLREVFRQHWQTWPTGYDLVINVRPHKRLSVSEYTELLAKGIQSIDRRAKRTES